ncbi:hypothetical protein KIN20_033316 [Parelaphostrongylus tenuis]|uniref:Uncharacterized protein n=1 Tax=Parelaphostrongylus tenuis TaxID=148309 RepID=A0AAD5R8B7_PARTN|nr:hypothetical protein KIN20_033316 [Parelaphostrongylus tenuis]
MLLRLRWLPKGSHWKKGRPVVDVGEKQSEDVLEKIDVWRNGDLQTLRGSMLTNNAEGEMGDETDDSLKENTVGRSGKATHPKPYPLMTTSRQNCIVDVICCRRMAIISASSSTNIICLVVRE